MSRKTKSNASKVEATPALVPKLRFPEFQNAEEWEIEALGQLADYENGKAYEQDILEDGKYVVVNSRFISTDGTVRKYTNAEYLIAKAGEVLMVLSDLPNGRALAKCYFVEIDDRYAVNQRVCRLKPRRIDGKFLYYTLNRHPRLLAYDDGLSQTHLSKGGVTECPLCVPAQKSEQQKIASCLSSVDELIAAQARKLDALKTHKKGLMQQLFPREGETQPRLRFPEFQNAGEWVAKPLGEIFPITSSKRVHESDWTATGVPFYRAREIVALNKHEPIQPLFISEDLYAEFSKLTGEIREGHLLVTGVGSIGVPYLVKAGDRFYFKDGNIIWLKNDGKVLTGDFLLRLYETDYVQKQLKKMADVGTVATYTIDNAKRTIAAFPTDKAEQQRIATCLSSLDALITAETQKHEALKTHKKGLMQQLFPTGESLL